MMYRSPSVTLSSRTIINNPYQKRLSQVNYQSHQKRLQQIRKPLSTQKLKEPSHIKLLHNIQKYKQASKSLLANRTEETRKKENSIILGKLSKIYNKDEKKMFKSISTKLSPIKIVSNISQPKKKREQEILEKNLVLIQNIKQINKTPRQMKLNIKKQINDYLSTRARLRRNVLPTEERKHKKELSLSKISRSHCLKSASSIRSLRQFV